MQPINYGAPIYPNCFDLLTTHGVVAEDVVGYITDQPSPYLQNYVAQRGGVPTIPGQILPDPLPGLPSQPPLPRTDVYQTTTVSQQNTIPNQHAINNYVQNPKNDSWKKAALAVLLTGIAGFGLYKFGSAIRSFRNGSAGTTNGFLQNIGNAFKSVGTKIADFFKNLWAKIKP